MAVNWESYINGQNEPVDYMQPNYVKTSRVVGANTLVGNIDTTGDTGGGVTILAKGTSSSKGSIDTSNWVNAGRISLTVTNGLVDIQGIIITRGSNVTSSSGTLASDTVSIGSSIRTNGGSFIITDSKKFINTAVGV